MTDQELLELAAKAAGIKGSYVSLDEYPDWMTVHDGEGVYYTSSQAWNPLADDGDAFRLAVRLSLNVNIYNLVVSYENADEYIEKHFPEGVIYDVAEATRRAIVRVAAEIGREK